MNTTIQFTEEAIKKLIENILIPNHMYNPKAVVVGASINGKGSLLYLHTIFPSYKHFKIISNWDSHPIGYPIDPYGEKKKFLSATSRANPSVDWLIIDPPKNIRKLLLPNALKYAKNVALLTENTYDAENTPPTIIVPLTKPLKLTEASKKVHYFSWFLWLDTYKEKLTHEFIVPNMNIDKESFTHVNALTTGY